MVKVGVDVHEHTDCAVGVDLPRTRAGPADGRATTRGTVYWNPRGTVGPSQVDTASQLLRWACKHFGEEVEFAVEDFVTCLRNWNARCSLPVPRWCGSPRS